jgi:hypothetical protein
MKKTRGTTTFVLTIFLLLLITGCSNAGGVDGTQINPINISGDYAGTMTFSKVEIVYDSDEDANGEEIRDYYEPEGKSDWLGESMPVNYRVAVSDDKTVTLTGMDEDGAETEMIQGEYDQDESRFYYVTQETWGETEFNLTFNEADGMVTAKGTILFTHTETGLVNEITIDLKKI